MRLNDVERTKKKHHQLHQEQQQQQHRPKCFARMRQNANFYVRKYCNMLIYGIG